MSFLDHNKGFLVAQTQRRDLDSEWDELRNVNSVGGAISRSEALLTMKLRENVQARSSK